MKQRDQVGWNLRRFSQVILCSSSLWLLQWIFRNLLRVPGEEEQDTSPSPLCACECSFLSNNPLIGDSGKGKVEAWLGFVLSSRERHSAASGTSDWEKSPAWRVCVGGTGQDLKGCVGLGRGAALWALGCLKVLAFLFSRSCTALVQNPELHAGC